MKNDSYAINAIKNKQYVIVDCKLMPSNIFKALTKITIDIVVKKIEKMFNFINLLIKSNFNSVIIKS